MNILIALVIGAVVGYLVGKKRAITTPQPLLTTTLKAVPPWKGGMGGEEVAGQQKDKAEGKAKILEMFSGGPTPKNNADVVSGQAEITNNDVEQALGISDRSATRYLEELEQEGKIVQIGRTGRSVTYRKR